jgi:voltage-gated potassium channel
VILALLIGGIAAAAQRALLSPASAEIQRDLQEIEENVEDVEEDVEDVEEDVESLLQNVRGLSATDRVVLKELHDIKRRLDEVQLEPQERAGFEEKEAR